MKKRILTIFAVLSKIYASYVLGLTILLFPPLLLLNQSFIFSISSPLFSSSILQQNVLDALRIVALNSPTSTQFVQSEVSHLQDVHVLFAYFYIIGLINLFISFRTKIPKLILHKYLAWSAIAIVILTVVGALFFNFAFEAFHELLFPQGNFAFPADSMLIQTFPPLFWLLQFIELQAIVVLSLLF